MCAQLFAIVALAGSAATPLQPIDFSRVRVEGYWRARVETNRLSTIPYCFRKCEETGRIANFARAAGLEPGTFTGTAFDDSDVYKVIEGAACSLALTPDAALDRYLDDLIAKIAGAQEPDGYLYTVRRLLPPERLPRMAGRERWSNLKDSHELYNLGHLIEAAVAHWRSTGKTNLLAVARRAADLVASLWLDQGMGWPEGHPEIELALLRLADATGQPRYREAARRLMEIRGRPETHRLYGPYAQDHQPVLEQREAVGHAVRALYLYTAMARYAGISAEPAWREAVRALWEDIVRHKLYVTGGLGARGAGESFGAAYELPNETAYAETCAAIAGVLFSSAMLQLEADARHADVLERILYNGVLCGVSLRGDRFFYPNPLASDGRGGFNHGRPERQPWFGCSCCPVNIARAIPQVGGWMYSVGEGRVYVHLFEAGVATADVAGVRVELRQATRYPWAGEVAIDVRPERPARFELMVRIPGWAKGRPVPSDLYTDVTPPTDAPQLSLNGEPVDLQRLERGYARLSKVWNVGDRVELRLPMLPRRVRSHPAVSNNAGHVALERGPIVYCIEGADHPGGRVRNLWLPEDAPLSAEERPELLGGVVVIRAPGRARGAVDLGRLEDRPAEILAIPYNVWCHRGANEMRVWIPTSPAGVTPHPAATLEGRATVSASFCHAADTPEAANDGVLPASSSDGGIPRMTWWDHRGTSEWIQYEWPAPVRVRGVEVYWFDDTGRGRCRVPASWGVRVREREKWVAPRGACPEVPSVERDRFNRVEFEPVETTALRIEVVLQPEFSGGVLEWRVIPAGP
ncbi:MAG: glycoside hydrolase family 127 protein [Kiritimatiellae bacterium]|nr:glycoside hydrolase family 127 protein [Kiritimatiellia bacterium]